MVTTYVRKADSGRAPKKELALLSNEARIERRQLQKKIQFSRWKAERALAKKTAQPTTIVAQKLEETDDSQLDKMVVQVVIELKDKVEGLQQSQEELKDIVEELEQSQEELKDRVEELEDENKLLKYQLLQLKSRKDEEYICSFKIYDEADLKLGISKDNPKPQLRFNESKVNEFELDYDTDKGQFKRGKKILKKELRQTLVWCANHKHLVNLLIGPDFDFAAIAQSGTPLNRVRDKFGHIVKPVDEKQWEFVEIIGEGKNKKRYYECLKCKECQIFSNQLVRCDNRAVHGERQHQAVKNLQQKVVVVPKPHSSD